MTSNSVIVITTIILFVFTGGLLFNIRNFIIDIPQSKYSFLFVYFILFLLIISNYTIGTNIKVIDKSKDEPTNEPQEEIEKRISNYVIVVICLVLLLLLIFMGGFIYIRKKGI